MFYDQFSKASSKPVSKLGSYLSKNNYPRKYKIQKGDRYWTIAQRFDLDSAILEEYNNKKFGYRTRGLRRGSEIELVGAKVNLIVNIVYFLDWTDSSGKLVLNDSKLVAEGLKNKIISDHKNKVWSLRNANNKPVKVNLLTNVYPQEINVDSVDEVKNQLLNYTQHQNLNKNTTILNLILGFDGTKTSQSYIAFEANLKGLDSNKVAWQTDASGKRIDPDSLVNKNKASYYVDSGVEAGWHKIDKIKTIINNNKGIIISKNAGQFVCDYSGLKYAEDTILRDISFQVHLGHLEQVTNDDKNTSEDEYREIEVKALLEFCKDYFREKALVGY